MGWNPETGEFDPEYEDDNARDLSVLHRWELLHMIWEPFALGAFGRVLSVLFRILPPGRSLFMSLSAVAREAARRGQANRHPRLCDLQSERHHDTGQQWQARH